MTSAHSDMTATLSANEEMKLFYRLAGSVAFRLDCADSSAILSTYGILRTKQRVKIIKQMPGFP